jgi:hypothetical protein
MPLTAVLADYLPDLAAPSGGLFLPVAAGVVAGLGVVGAIHLLVRGRQPAAAPPAAEQPALDPFVHGSASEQRGSFRRQGNPVEVQVVNQTTHSVQMRGWVVDRSVGGLGLLMDQPIDAGSLLTVRPTNAPPLTPWIEVTVRSCRQSNPGYEVGCQFVKTPPWALLLTFG